MRDESEEAIKRRFASLISTLLRSSAQGDERNQRQLQTTVERSAKRVLVRLHWRRADASDRDHYLDEVVCYREFPQPGDLDVVIVITREVEAPSGVPSNVH